MSLRFGFHPAETAWLETGEDRRSFLTTLTIGPPGFEAYARVLSLPDPEYDEQDVNDLPDEVFEAMPVEADVVADTVALLPGGSDRDDLRFLLWDGHPYEPELPSGRRVHLLRLRSCATATGSIPDFRAWTRASPGRGFPPAFVWPPDRSWCVAYDVDSHFAGVAGTRTAVGRVLSESRHTALPVDRRALPAMYL